MGYLHIDNLYRSRDVLLFEEVYALKKVHGTSAHVAWRDGQLHLFSGESKDAFEKLFDRDALAAAFIALGYPAITIYGEAHGGRILRQSYRYGPEVQFVAFDVKIGDTWLDVPTAEDIAHALGLDFVAYARIPTKLSAIDAERDAPSIAARRNGVEGDQPREGVVLRPLVESARSDGKRIIAKHKRDAERETGSPRVVGADPEVLKAAQAIAEEWVTPTRLEHILQKLPGANIEQTKDVILAMLEDVRREGEGEFVESRDATKAMGTRTAQLFKIHLRNALTE